MGALTELDQFDAEVFRVETDTVWVGGEDGFANRQGKNLTNRTRYLYNLCQALLTNVNDRQPGDATLTALAAVATAADKLIYATGPDAFALTNFTAFARTLVAVADASAARGVLSVPSVADMNAAIAALVASSPAALDTLNELAAALGNDANFATTITNALALKAPLASPAFTGSPTVPTPAQFDNSTKAATSEFVQRALGNCTAFTALPATTVLSASSVGTAYRITSASSTTITLPPVGSIPAGSVVRLFNDSNLGGVAHTVKGNAAEYLRFGATAPANTMILAQGETADFVSDGFGWWVFGSNAKDILGSLASFASSLAANGYQKLPSGLILQWGVGLSNGSGQLAITFPIAFPNSARSIVGVSTGGAFVCITTAMGSATGNIQTNTTSTGAVAAGVGVSWIAIGN